MTTDNLESNPFSLLRSFSLLSLLSISIISAVSAYFLSQFLREHILQRDAVVTMEFVQGIAEAQNTGAYFSESGSGEGEVELDRFFEQISHMPDVVRANAYTKNFTIIWSNTKELIGKSFPDNHELHEALEGDLVYEVGKVEEPVKTEHVLFGKGVKEFVENYIPVRDTATEEVVGVVEVYRIPTALTETLRMGTRLVWASAALGGVFLYAVLFWIVRRASLVIQNQHSALVRSERLAAVGEMASSVAHSIRNPIATIRSSAELAMEETDGPVREYMQDIIGEVDRFERWVRELLTFSRNEPDTSRTALLSEVLQKSVASFGAKPERQGVRVVLDVPEASPEVRGDSSLLAQVFNSLLSNALEAMPEGGQLTIGCAVNGKMVDVWIQDTGKGISREKLEGLFKPLVTHKRGGLGIGLTLARQILHRYGGNLELSSEERIGTTARVQLARVE